jgi:hypothetical protein
MGLNEIECDFSSLYDLDEIQLRAVELTVEGFTDVQIATMLSINRRTLWRWKTHDEHYRRALADVRSQLHSAVSDQFRALLLRALTVLSEFLEDPSSNNRFRAAHALLTMASCFKSPPPMLPAPVAPPRIPAPDLPYKMG